MFNITLHDALTYGFLSLALLALWIPPKGTKRFRIRLWHIFCIAAIGCGLLFGYVDLSGLLAIAILGVSCYYAASEQYTKSIRIMAGIIMFALSASLSLHIVPGFSNPKVLSDVVISEGGVPYSKHLNFDKALVGLFLLGFTFKNLLSTPQAWGRMLRQMAPISAITIIVLIFMSFVLGYVRFEPKWSALFWFWAWTNLLFTCIAEEAVFRGIMQRYLVAGLSKYRYGAIIGLVIAAVLFGLMHYAGGIKYVLLSTIAGLGYGWVYLRTRQIEASILTHFLLNCIHFVFFTYPVLATAIR